MSLTHRILAAGVLLAAASAPAGACTLANWSDSTGSQGLSVGSPASSQRRFDGECGLKVVAGGAPRYVEDDSPDAEPKYIVRFYYFAGDLELAPGDWVDLFGAYQNETRPSPEFVVRLEQTADGRQLVVRARDGASFENTDPIPVRGGWRGVELNWTQATGPTNGQLVVEVDGTRRASLSGLDSRGRAIDLARLGALESRGGDGALDFDAFASHRATAVGPLLAGDATDDQALNAADLVAVITELNGGAFAKGQPDCNGDGAVDEADLNCLALAIVGGGS